MKFAIHQTNDKLFKLSMSEIVVAKEFFSAHLPAEILKSIDLDTLKLEKETFIDPAYKDTEADVVYSVKMGGSTAYLYLLCEQQTTVDKWLAFRLLVYTVRIMEMHRKQHPEGPLPVVYPLVVYVGQEPWSAPLEIFPLFAEAESLAREILYKPYQLLDIHRIHDDELRQQQLFGLVAFVLKYRKTRNFKAFLESFMEWVQQIEAEVVGVSLSRLVLQYVIDRSPQGDKDLLAQEAERYLSKELQGEIMTIAQQWKQEGMQQGMQQGMLQGIQQGMQQGMQRGEATLLKLQLQRRFGNLPVAYAQRIENSDAKTLLHFGEKILDAKTLEDVFKDDE